MNRDERYTTGLVFESGESGVAPVDIGLAMLTAPLSAARKGVKRPASVLQKLEPVKAGSEEEVYRKFNVRVTGAYRDLAGKEVSVDLAVRSADIYTPNGLVNAHDSLHALYVGTVTAETLAAELQDADRPPLDDQEIEALESAIRELDEADAVEEQ